MFDNENEYDDIYLEGYYDALLYINEGLFSKGVKVVGDVVLNKVIPSKKKKKGKKKPEVISTQEGKNKKGEKVVTRVYDDGTTTKDTNGKKVLIYANGDKTVVNKNTGESKTKTAKPTITDKISDTVSNAITNTTNKVQEKVNNTVDNAKKKIGGDIATDEIEKRQKVENERDNYRKQLEQEKENSKNLQNRLDQSNKDLSLERYNNKNTKKENEKLKKSNKKMKGALIVGGTAAAGYTGYKIYKHFKNKKEGVTESFEQGYNDAIYDLKLNETYNNIEILQEEFDDYFTEEQVINYLMTREECLLEEAIDIYNEGFLVYMFNKYK